MTRREREREREREAVAVMPAHLLAEKLLSHDQEMFHDMFVYWSGLETSFTICLGARP